jgi:SAM-dependent methyltransferase
MVGPTMAYRAYEPLAGSYDAYLSEVSEHERWVVTLEAIARQHGVPGRRLLDVACGTGRSTEPFVALGYDAWACDVSPAMVRLAKRRIARAGGRGHVDVADMRRLPNWGRFDIVTCLCDAVNYLLDLDELDEAFASVARALRPGGLYIFDVNSLGTYRTVFTNDFTIEADIRFHWRGVSRGETTPGRLYASELRSSSGPRDTLSVHIQRHWPVELIRRRLELAGLRCLCVLGQAPGIVLTSAPDESRDIKTVFVARREPDQLGSSSAPSTSGGTS